VRILYDHQVFSLQNAGGASRYHYELMRYLADVPEIHSELFLGVTGCIYPFGDLLKHRVRVTRLGSILKPGMARYVLNEFMGNIWSAKGRFDIYHPTLYRRMPLVRAKRLVVTHHDCVQERFPELFPNVKAIIREKRRLFAHADAIICVSESSRKDLLEFYAVDAAKTRVIHHGLSPLPRCARSEAELRTLAARQYLLFVGSRAPYKGFKGLLTAFSATGLHRSMDLLVLGGGALTPSEVALADHLKISDSIVSLPSATDALLGEAYAAAMLFVYPSLYEGFGFPPLEAMAAGCPVLVSNTSSLPEICRTAPFYFAPQDQSSFQAALLHAIGDEKARHEAAERGKVVAAEYEWKTCGERTLALYREC